MQWRKHQRSGINGSGVALASAAAAINARGGKLRGIVSASWRRSAASAARQRCLQRYAAREGAASAMTKAAIFSNCRPAAINIEGGMAQSWHDLEL